MWKRNKVSPNPETCITVRVRMGPSLLPTLLSKYYCFPLESDGFTFLSPEVMMTQVLAGVGGRETTGKFIEGLMQ